MTTNKVVVEKLTDTFKLRYHPIAFFYTDDFPQEVYKPKKKKIEFRPCIIQFLNGVKNGKTLVLGKRSRNLCPSGYSCLGFKKFEINDASLNYLAMGIFDPEGNKLMEGEHWAKTSDLVINVLENIDWKPAPATNAVFMPLDNVDLNKYKPLLVIFHVNMDQLAGLICLSNFDNVNKAKIGLGATCQNIIIEPLLELEKEKKPRAIIGGLSDTTPRCHLKSDEAIISIGYDRLLEMMENIEISVLGLDKWKKIQKRITQ